MKDCNLDLTSDPGFEGTE